eukprot:1878306-Prymnesium_polylepis.1
MKSGQLTPAKRCTSSGHALPSHIECGESGSTMLMQKKAGTRTRMPKRSCQSSSGLPISWRSRLLQIFSPRYFCNCAALKSVSWDARANEHLRVVAELVAATTAPAWAAAAR